MIKMKVYTMPVSRASLYFISVFEVHAIFVIIGIAAGLCLLLAGCVRIFARTMPVNGLGSIALCELAISGMLQLFCCFLTQTRMRPAYRYYRKNRLHFPACLKGKYMTCTDQEHYIL